MGILEFDVSNFSHYIGSMETVVHNVPDLNAADRATAERLIGHTLRDDQQLVLAIRPGPPGQTGMVDESLPEWLNVYEGLTDERIEELEAAISRRLELGQAK